MKAVSHISKVTERIRIKYSWKEQIEHIIMCRLHTRLYCAWSGKNNGHCVISYAFLQMHIFQDIKPKDIGIKN
jgi:hypothetical protein